MRDRTVTCNRRRCRPFKGRDRGSGGPVDPRAGATSGQIWSPSDGHDGARGARSVGAGGSTNQALTDFGSAEKLCLQPPAHGKRIFANKRQVQIFGKQKWEVVKSQTSLNWIRIRRIPDFLFAPTSESLEENNLHTSFEALEIS